VVEVDQFVDGETQSVGEDFQQAEQASRRCCHQYYPLEYSRLLSLGLLRYSTADRWAREWNLALSRQQVDGLVLNQYDFALGVVAAYAAAAVVVAVAVVAAAAAVVVVAAAAAAVVVVAAAVAAAVVVAVVAAAAAVAVVVVVAAALDASFQCVLGLAHVDLEPRVLGGLVQVVFEALFPAFRALASLEFPCLCLCLCLCLFLCLSLYLYP
jgi:hypothetical protein